MTEKEITQIYNSGLNAVVELILRIEQEKQLLKEKNELLEEKINQLSRDSTTYRNRLQNLACFQSRKDVQKTVNQKNKSSHYQVEKIMPEKQKSL